MELSYHNSNVVPELAVTTQTFCTVLAFLQLGLWNMGAEWLKSSLQKFYGHHYELVDRYNSVSICTMKNNLFNVSKFSFSLSSTFGLYFLWAIWQVFLEKHRTLTLPVHLVHSPIFSEFAHLLLFVRVILVILCYLLCVPVFLSGLNPWTTFFWLPLESWIPWLLFMQFF